MVSLVGEAQPEAVHTQCESTGYTHAQMKKAYMAYEINWMRSATAPDTMVAVEMANCMQKGISQGQTSFSMHGPNQSIGRIKPYTSIVLVPGI